MSSSTSKDNLRKKHKRHTDPIWRANEQQKRREWYKRTMAENGESAARMRQHAKDTKRKHYKTNYIKQRKWTTRWNEIAKEIKGNMCTACGLEDIRLLQFDHRDETTKDSCITTITNTMTKTPSEDKWRRFVSELNKCRLLCANCHMLRTHYNLTIVEREQDCIVYSDE